MEELVLEVSTRVLGTNTSAPPCLLRILSCISGGKTRRARDLGSGGRPAATITSHSDIRDSVELDGFQFLRYAPHQEVDVELSKKTTLLFSPDLHRQLTRLARQRGESLGELVRQACEAHYGIVSRESRVAAVRALEAMSLPVGDPEQIERESVPTPEDLLP